MKFLARITGDEYGTREVVLVPNGRRYLLNVRPRPPLGGLVTVSLRGLDRPNAAGIQAWLANESGEPGINELRAHLYRRTELADFMDAVNAEQFIDATSAWNPDTRVAFARASGSELLAEVRAELDGEARVKRVAQRARLFTRIVGIPGAAALLDQLAEQHDVEHLVALEHAIVRWIGNAAMLRDLELSALSRTLPDEDASAGISDDWFGWWWRLARACTRDDLKVAVESVLDHVDRECTGARKVPVAVDARTGAREMLERMRLARHATLWAGPYDENVVVKTIVRDQTDAHYAAFMAVSHAAHAFAHELGARLSPSQANRQTMKVLAEVAIAAIVAANPPAPGAADDA